MAIGADRLALAGTDRQIVVSTADAANATLVR
jgi:hypothetical protein